MTIHLVASKVLEKVLNIQLQNHLTVNGLFSPEQYVYQANKSTLMAFIEIYPITMVIL